MTGQPSASTMEAKERNLHNGSEHRLADAEYERLSALLDERLPPDERQELIAHLEQCITCRNELAALRQLQMLLQQVPPPALPRSFTLPLDTPAPLTLQASSIRNRSRRHINSWLRGIGAVAAVIGLLILITGLVTIPHGGASMAGSGAVTNNRPVREFFTISRCPESGNSEEPRRTGYQPAGHQLITISHECATSRHSNYKPDDTSGAAGRSAHPTERRDTGQRAGSIGCYCAHRWNCTATARTTCAPPALAALDLPCS
jgi:hypothetical protein